MMLALSGWGQPADALASLAPDARTLDYGALPDTKALWQRLSGESPRIVIGWSLGGQLAVRAIARGVLRPAALVLIATPYQWLEGEDWAGFPRREYRALHADFAHDPAAFLKRFRQLMLVGDARAQEISRSLPKLSTGFETWGYWLDELANFSCNTIDFKKFPPTMIVHGEGDAVIASANAGRLASSIAGATCLLIPDAGHVPQAHAIPRIREWIRDHMKNE